MPYTLPTTEDTSYVRAGSVEVSMSLLQRDTCTFQTVDEAGSFAFAPGDQVAFTLSDGTTRVFSGLVWDTTQRLSPGNGALFSGVRCVDFTALLDRRRVIGVWEDTAAGDIIKDIIGAYFDGDNINTDSVEDGPVFASVAFNYDRASEAFDQLAEMTGYFWRIDYDRALVFTARDTYTAPFSIADASTNWRDLTLERSLDQYRNVQILRGGTAKTDARTETFHGDLATSSYILAFPVATVPIITVNGISKTVGIGQVETGRDWYWNKGSNVISQDQAAGPLSSSDTLLVTYEGQYPLLAIGLQEAEITARAAQQGDTGRYDHVEVDGRIDNVDLAADRISGLLSRYATISPTLTFVTDSVIEPDATSLKPGQLLTVDLAGLGLTSTYLVTDVSVREVDATLFEYRVTAVSGELVGGWVQFFRALASQKLLTLNADAQVAQIVPFADAAPASDELAASSAAPNSTFGSAQYDFAEFG